MSRPTSVKEAIKIITEHREIHVMWADYRREGGRNDPGAGNLRHHLKCAKRYERILLMLEQMA
jgi:hypothetical protein